VRRALAAVGLAALVLPAAAAASVTFQSVDTSGYPHVRLTVVTSEPSTSAPKLLEDGAPAFQLHAVNLQVEKSVVLAVDRSQSMRGKPLRQAVTAARAFVAAKRPADRFAVTAFADRAVQLSGFSSSPAVADAALHSIRTVGRVQGTRIYDDVLIATQALAGEARDGRVLVLLTDGADTVSKTSLSRAVGAAKRAHVVVYVVAIKSPKFEPGAMKKLTGQTGGRFYEADAGSLTAIYKRISDELGRTWRLEYTSTGVPGEHARLHVSLGREGAADRTVVLPFLFGGVRVKLPFLFTRNGGYAFAGFIGLIALIGSLVVLASMRQGWLMTLVAPHLGRKKPEGREKKPLRERLNAFSGLFAATERLLSGTTAWRWLGRLLERSDLPLRTVELVYLMIGAGAGFGIFMKAFGVSGVVLVFAFLIGLCLPIGYVVFKIRRRRKAFDDQLPDLLASLAASLKAGHSFRSALQSLVDEGVEPAGKELNRVLAETRLGRPIEDALADMATRLESRNWEFVVTAVGIQTQVGGSLANLFDTLAETIRQRHQFARKVKSLTAMGRMSAYVLVAVPIVLGLMLTLVNREYMAPLWHTSGGHTILGLTVVMILIGAAFLKKIVSFKG
jgi:tight adherence protein B